MLVGTSYDVVFYSYIYISHNNAQFLVTYFESLLSFQLALLLLILLIAIAILGEIVVKVGNQKTKIVYTTSAKLVLAGNISMDYCHYSSFCFFFYHLCTPLYHAIVYIPWFQWSQQRTLWMLLKMDKIFLYPIFEFSCSYPFFTIFLFII